MRALPVVLVLAFASFLLACGSTDPPSSDGGAPGDAQPATDGGTTPDARPAGDSAPPQGADAASNVSCASAGDCRLYSDDCGGCTCVPLGAGDVDPVCKGTVVSCFVDPCEGKAAACTGGHCTAQ